MIKRISLIYAAVSLIIMTFLQGGCATNKTIKNHGMVKEVFFGTGPAYAVSNSILVQGITQIIPNKGHMKEHPSYVSIAIVSNRVETIDWISPGELPADIKLSSSVPYQRDDLQGVATRFADIRSSNFPAKYYGGNWLLLIDPENPIEPRQFAIAPSKRYRATSSYPSYVIVLTGSIVFDIVTSPFQLIGAVFLNKAYENWH